MGSESERGRETERERESVKRPIERGWVRERGRVGKREKGEVKKRGREKETDRLPTVCRLGCLQSQLRSCCHVCYTHLVLMAEYKAFGNIPVMVFSFSLSLSLTHTHTQRGMYTLRDTHTHMGNSYSLQLGTTLSFNEHISWEHVLVPVFLLSLFIDGSRGG